eukprot:m.112254 g.112254  ORF g.112254 m.112254 type:complete len:287 (+) comp28180_c0_seq1:335-1195(+)
MRMQLPQRQLFRTNRGDEPNQEAYDSAFIAKYYTSNKGVYKHELGAVTLATAGATQQLCSIVLLLMFYRGLLTTDTDLRPLIGCVGVTILLTYVISMIYCPQESQVPTVETVVRGAGHVFALYAVSPVLNTLTDSISTNTIYWMVSVMLGFNLLLNDYKPTPRAQRIVLPGALNAGTFAAVCLASRLPTARDAFMLTCAAMVNFAVWPLIRARVRGVSWLFEVVQTCSIVLMTVTFAYSLWFESVFVIVGAVVVITVVSPWLFVRLQYLKRVYSGAWDEAVVTIDT